MSKATTAQLPRGVIIEFDFAVLAGHALMKEICFARFAKEKLDVDLKKLYHFFGGKTFKYGLNALCKKLGKNVNVSEVATACQSQFGEALKNDIGNMPAGFHAFVKALVSKNIKAVLVTRVESETVQAAFADIVSDNLIVMHECPSSFCFTNREAWSRIAAKNDLYERLCVAVAGSGFSVKGALKSGFSVMVKTNPLTDYQDTSGSDVRINEYSAALVDEVVQILRI